MVRRGTQRFALLLAVSGTCAAVAAFAQTDAGAPPVCGQPSDPGCLELAARLLAGTGGPRAPTHAADLYSKACDAGNGDACFQLARLFESATGTLTSFSQALTFLRKACALKNAEACTEAGALVVEGVGTGDAGVGDASPLFEQGCSLGSGLACLRLAGAGEPGGSANRGRAAALYERACQAGEPSGCSNFFALSLTANGPVKAGPILKQEIAACERDDSLACWLVGDLYRDGLGVVRSFPSAATYYQRACDAEEPLACTSLGDLYLAGQGVSADRKRAAALFRTACQEGDDDACSRSTSRRGKH